MMQESDPWRLYTGRAVMEMERLWWEAGWGSGRGALVPAPAESVEQGSALQSEEEPDREEDSEEDTAEGQGEDEEEEEKASETLL